MSSVFYEMAKKNYMKGLWNRAMIDHLLKIGRLTQEEHDDIVGVENE
ncbi:MAG: XkdX family protein [Clostridium sp.]|nr:XkdX family protein [Clostridium sp.]